MTDLPGSAVDSTRFKYPRVSAANYPPVEGRIHFVDSRQKSLQDLTNSMKGNKKR